MLTKLTKKQEAMIPEYRDKWLKIGLSTEPLDFERAKSAATKCYQIAGLEPPKLWIRMRSPIEAAVAATILKNGAQVRDQVGAQVWAQVWAQVRAQVRDQVGDQVGDQVWDQVYGAHDASWLGFYDFFAVCGIDVAKLHGLIELAQCCGWWAPYKNVCILQDRPSKIQFDGEKRLHCESGPAIEYRDGFAVYAWHGTRIPKEWIESRETIDAHKLLTHENIEQRRAGCEILGWGRILEALNPTVIDTDADPEIGQLLQVDLPDSGPERFLKVKCGTGRDFVLPVPPDSPSALWANAWTYGLEDTENFFEKELRT